MKTDHIIQLIASERKLVQARAGKHNFINRMGQALRSVGCQLEFVPRTPASLLLAGDQGHRAVLSMEEPDNDRVLNMRKAYIGAFWRIETTNKRWEFRVANSRFSLQDIDAAAATDFANQWRKRAFDTMLADTRRDGFVLVALQGRLLRRRSFQQLSPIDMIEAVLAHEPRRKLLLSLHPGERYSAEELAAVQQLCDRQPRLHCVSGLSLKYLPYCDYVVTENSSVAFSGYFFHKPAVLFAAIDFHHIGFNVAGLGVERAFAHAQAAGQVAQPFDEYLYWFLKKTAINAGSDQAETQILAAMRAGGWQL